MKVLSLILGSILLSSLLLPLSFAEDAQIPAEVQIIFNWYTNGQIQYETFKQILNYLIDDDIFKINQKTTSENSKIQTKYINKLPLIISNQEQEAELTFMGLIPDTREGKKAISDIKGTFYFFKFELKNTSNKEQMQFSPMLLEDVQIKTDKRYFWQHNGVNSAFIEPISFYEIQINPMEEKKYHHHYIQILTDEKPEEVHMVVGDTKYIIKLDSSSDNLPLWDDIKFPLNYN